MPIPNEAYFRVYPRTVSQLVSGNFSQTGAGAPPPITTQDAMTTYYSSQVDGGDATAPRLWQGDNATGTYVPFIGTYELTFSPKTTVVFDQYGTPTPISFLDGDFPLGVVFSQLYIGWNGFLTVKGQLKQLTNYKFKARGTTVLDTVPTPDNLSGDTGYNSNQFGPTAISLLRWGPNQLFGTSFGFEATISTASAGGLAIGPSWRTDLFYIEGLYHIQTFSITSANQNAGPGGEVTIAGTSLTTFNELSIAWYDAAAPSTSWLDPMIPNIVGGIVVPTSMILTHTSTSIVLRIPYNLIPYGGKKLMIRGRDTTGVLFAGYALLSNVNIQLVDGSGIYTLTADKTNDTYYDRAVGPNATVDLKIPDPLGKTGFFSG